MPVFTKPKKAKNKKAKDGAPVLVLHYPEDGSNPIMIEGIIKNGTVTVKVKN